MFAARLRACAPPSPGRGGGRVDRGRSDPPPRPQPPAAGRRGLAGPWAARDTHPGSGCGSWRWGPSAGRAGRAGGSCCPPPGLLLRAASTRARPALPPSLRLLSFSLPLSLSLLLSLALARSLALSPSLEEGNEAGLT